MIGNFGFIRENIEIKVLILFILQRLPEPVALDVLADLTMCDEGIRYFDVTDCVSKLVDTQHLRLENNKYSLTAKGDRNGEILAKNLPYSVRKKAEDAAADMRVTINRDAMIKTKRSICEDGGYKVLLTLSDGIGDIISMELFAANEKRADKLEQGFRKNAEKVYQAIIDMLMTQNIAHNEKPARNENLDGNYRV